MIEIVAKFVTSGSFNLLVNPLKEVSKVKGSPLLGRTGSALNKNLKVDSLNPSCGARIQPIKF